MDFRAWAYKGVPTVKKLEELVDSYLEWMQDDVDEENEDGLSKTWHSAEQVIEEVVKLVASGELEDARGACVQLKRLYDAYTIAMEQM